MWRDAVQAWLYRPEAGAPARLASRVVGRVAAWRAGRPRSTSPVPVVVVGALSVGGAGKTPVVELLARHFLSRGARLAIVMRGWGGRTVSGRVAAADAHAFGDEAAAMRRALPGVDLWVGRADAVRAAARSADLVLVDDGFQDPGLPRTADVVVVDATAPRRVLPAGPLREPISALARADVVWLHKVDEPGACADVPAHVESVVAPRALLGPTGERREPDWLRGRPVVLLSGIGRPSSFRHTVERLGADVVASYDRADHHRFGAAELRRLVARGLPIVTTTKDRERLPPGFPGWVLDVEVRVRRGWETLEALP